MKQFNILILRVGTAFQSKGYHLNLSCWIVQVALAKLLFIYCFDTVISRRTQTCRAIFELHEIVSKFFHQTIKCLILYFKKIIYLLNVSCSKKNQTYDLWVSVLPCILNTLKIISWLLLYKFVGVKVHFTFLHKIINIVLVISLLACTYGKNDKTIICPHHKCSQEQSTQ